MPASNSNVQEWNERTEAELAALRAENEALRSNSEAIIFALDPIYMNLSKNQRQAFDNLRAALEATREA